MDDLNITMEEDIQLMADKARRHGQTFNWETPTNDEDEDYTFIHNKDSSSYKLIPVNDLKLEPVNDHIEINTKLCSKNIDVKPMDNVIYISKDTTPIEFNKNIKTNDDTAEPMDMAH
nr:hypothetical protein [Tanacetum cinerariifolium]